MSVKRLSQETAKDLISKYNAELKAMDFQVSEIKSTLKELVAHHAKLKKVSDAKAAKKAKKAAAIAKKKAAAAKKKAAAAAKKKAAAAKKKAAAAAKRKAAAAKKAAKRKAAAAKKAAKKTTRKAAPKRKAKKATAKRGRKPARKKAKKAAPKKRVAKKAIAKKTTKRKAAPKRKAKKAAPKRKTAKKVTARKSKGGARGRKMSYSDWDMLVLNSLKGRKTPVRTSSLLEAGTKHAKKGRGKSDEKFVRGKIAASLQKLVNKTKEVKKVPAAGRGFSYRLK